MERVPKKGTAVDREMHVVAGSAALKIQHAIELDFGWNGKDIRRDYLARIRRDGCGDHVGIQVALHVGEEDALLLEIDDNPRPGSPFVRPLDYRIAKRKHSVCVVHAGFAVLHRLAANSEIVGLNLRDYS